MMDENENAAEQARVCFEKHITRLTSPQRPVPHVKRRIMIVSDSSVAYGSRARLPNPSNAQAYCEIENKRDQRSWNLAARWWRAREKGKKRVALLLSRPARLSRFIMARHIPFCPSRLGLGHFSLPGLDCIAVQGNGLLSMCVSKFYRRKGLALGERQEDACEFDTRCQIPHLALSSKRGQVD